MSIRLDLIDTLTAACPTGCITAQTAAAVFESRRNGDGGFRGKGPQSDLYYTGFALMSLTALNHPLDAPGLPDFLDRFENRDELDLAHLAALIRCRRLLNQLSPSHIDALAGQLQTFRCKDGAYHHLSARSEGSAYGCFLAVGAYQDLGRDLPDAQAVIDCLNKLNANGGYYNESSLPLVSTPGTAAAVTTLTQLGRAVDPRAADWLLHSRDAHGGFKVMPAAPVADLLSTAVALHALDRMNADLSPIRAADLAFVTGLWDSAIGFCQNRIDPISDCEYCFYGLLSLGHLR